jgi:phosphocarrier protein FPr
MEQLRITIRHEAGLHLRPLNDFLLTVNEYEADAQIRNMTTDSRWADARSSIEIILIAVEKDHEIELQAEGSDEKELIAAVENLIRSNFGEDES